MTTQTAKFFSKIDESVNTVLDGFETRYVRREDADIIYLSSFKGCDLACRMCHLTQQGQTDMTAATHQDFITQAVESLREMMIYRRSIGDLDIKTIHFNFMARGEPLKNQVILHEFDKLAQDLISVTVDETGLVYPIALDIKFKISTVLPDLYQYDAEGRIVGGIERLAFKKHKPEIYYSIYSTDANFRRRWLPKAWPVQDALRVLANYDTDGGTVRFHSPFIFAENDDMIEVDNVIRAINYYSLPKKFNIIRYNSPDESKSQETPMEHLLSIKHYLELKGFEVQMVERVGEDVQASCGMFYAEQK